MFPLLSWALCTFCDFSQSCFQIKDLAAVPSGHPTCSTAVLTACHIRTRFVLFVCTIPGCFTFNDSKMIAEPQQLVSDDRLWQLQPLHAQCSQHTSTAGAALRARQCGNGNRWVLQKNGFARVGGHQDKSKAHIENDFLPGALAVSTKMCGSLEHGTERVWWW